MRFVVHGAGAIGGVVGALLYRAGHEVVLVARGAHHDAIAAHGLRLETPDAAATMAVPVVDHPRHIAWADDDVVLLCVKSQDTRAALDDLEATAPAAVPVVCLQNGVTNELEVARRFADVYGAHVMTPTGFVEPGVVTAWSAPVPGIIDVGRFPHGVDDRTRAVRAALADAGFSSQPLGAIRRWKYRKLITNLGNVVQAVCGAAPGADRVADLARSEGEQALAAAGIDVASPDEDARRRADWIQLRPIGGRRRPGGSTWQSLQRGAGSVEADHLNGEIVLLGRLHDVPTPCNALLRRTAVAMAAGREPPGRYRPQDLLAQLGVHAS